MRLHNKYSRSELKEAIKANEKRKLLFSFYKYFSIPNPVEFRNNLYTHLEALGILGRIYVSDEGINAQISVPESNIYNFENTLRNLHSELKGIKLNKAVDHKAHAFFMLKVKVRKKIVADGIDESDFNPSDTGHYIEASEFNELSNNRDTIVVDMRNHYEYEVGRFKNAITFSSDTFRDQISGTIQLLREKKDKHIILYCTGGIRCEKASAYLKYKGFQKVSHLKGGIINYYHQVKKQQLDNKFIGKNFVFDERLGERISHEVIAQCHQCGAPCDTHVNCANEGCHLLFIQCKKCATQFNKCCSEKCKETILLPQEVRKQKRKGIKNGQNIFNKSRQALLQKFSSSKLK